MKSRFALVIVACGALGSVDASEAIYFPNLAAAAQRSEPDALRAVLALSAATEPGEQLEELAEIASLYVRRSPALFLQAQAGKPTCFGVSFLGPAFTDQPSARTAEIAARMAALNSVKESRLAETRARCLAELAGS